MKKHLYGFAIFLLIVSSSVVTYRFLSTPPFTQIDPEHLEVKLQPHVEEREAEIPSGLSCEIKNMLIDVQEGYGTADVTFRWNSSEPAPEGLIVDVGVTTANSAYYGTHIGVVKLGSVWKKNTMTERIVFLLEDEADRLDTQRAYYGYVEASEWKGSGNVKLVYRPDNKLRNAVPVLIKHRKKVK